MRGISEWGKLTGHGRAAGVTHSYDRHDNNAGVPLNSISRTRLFKLAADRPWAPPRMYGLPQKIPGRTFPGHYFNRVFPEKFSQIFSKKFQKKCKIKISHDPNKQ